MCVLLPLVFSFYHGDTAVVDLNTETHKEIYTGNWLFEYYASWCGHCQHFAGTYEHIARELAPYKSVIKVGAINAGNQRILDLRDNIRGFPTIRLMLSGRTIEYTGGRNADDVINFVKEELGLVSHWVMFRLALA